MNSAFNDDLDWTSNVTPSGFTPTNFGANINVNKISRVVDEDFFDDFDNDDDEFFSSAVGGGAGASAGGKVDGAMEIDTTSSTVAGAPYNKATASTQFSFGMMALSYSDVSAALITPPNRARSTSNQGDADISGKDDVSDDLELLDLDQKYFSQLRDPSSSFRAVARSCLVCQQLTQAPNADQAASAVPSLQTSIRIQSTSVYHVQRYQRLTHRLISSLTTCLSTHNSSVCKSLAASTLASTARASYARLNFDAHLFSVRLPPSIATRLEDECGMGVAHSLVIAAIEQQDNAVSSASFEALGILTLDPNSDELAAEVKSIAYNSNHTVFAYENDVGTAENSLEMREVQSKIWDNVLFPRMQRILHRISMYSSFHHLAKAIPVITAAFVHALIQGPDTVPARRSLQCGKSAHAKRAWVESDAERLVTEFVDRILLPCFVQSSNKSDETLKRAAAVACIRLSSACPLARWRVAACRNAVTVLSRQLDEMMTLTSQTNSSNASSLESSLGGALFAQASAGVAVDTLSGFIAMLLIALRGIPVNERTPVLASVLRAAFLFLPMGTDSPSYIDQPTCSSSDSAARRHVRLCRVGLIAEVALSAMLDGSKDIYPCAAEVDHNAENSDGNERVIGARPILLNRIFRENNLAGLFRSNTAGCELVWVFCSIFLRIGEKCTYATTSAANWSNIGLVLLDNFASFLGTYELNDSPFATAASDAYSKLLAAMLKRSAVFPPSSLSISDSMFAATEKSSTASISSSVVGVPGDMSSQVALTLFKVLHALTLKRSKKASTNTTFESTKMNVQLNATLCDAWFGFCISSSDAKESSQEQLDIAFELLLLLRSDMTILLQMVGEDVENEKLSAVLYLIRVCLACVEIVACASEVISYGNSLKTTQQTGRVGAAAIAALKVVFTASKDIATTAQEGSGLCENIAADCNNAASRISRFIRGISQYYQDDIVTLLQPLNLGRNTSSGWPSMDSSRFKSTEIQLSFLYHHARLAIHRRANLAIDAYSSTTTSSLFSKTIRPFNPLRMNHTFSHTSIQVHQLVSGLPLLIPERAVNDTCAISLTGSSDPVSLVMSPSMRRVMKSNCSESIVLVISMRLHNITAVPIQNGVQLDVAIDDGDGDSVCTTSRYRNEIDAGDCITWEVILGDWKIGALSMRATVTFLGLEKESLTHKWLHGGEPAYLSGESPLVAGDDYEGTMDVSISCEPTTISTLFTLQPHPLVFFCGVNGDTNVFKFMWSQLEHISQIQFTTTTSDKDSIIFARKGSLTLSNGVTGCAFIAPSGDSILCKHQVNEDDPHSLFIKSNSLDLMTSLVGLPLEKSFLRFIFGENAVVLKEGTAKLNAMKHDFPSMTMQHSPINRAEF